MSDIEQYLSKVQAAVELEVSTATLDRRVRAGELTRYESRRDRRKVYFRAEDIERAKQPTPKESRTNENENENRV